MYILILLLTIGAGMLTPVQGCINGALGKSLGVWESSLFNMINGSILMIILTLIFGKGNILLFVNAPWWLIVGGGVIGTLMVLCMIIAAPKIGISLATVVLLVVSLMTNVVIDQYGLFGLAVKVISPYRLIGIGFMLAGIICSYYLSLKTSKAKQESATDEETKKAKWTYVLVMVASGILTAVYYPFTSQMTKIVGGVFESTFILFFVSFLIVLPIVLIWGNGSLKNAFKVPKWQLIGGYIGGSTVAWSLVSVVVLGAVGYSVSTTMGRIFLAVVIDFAGWLGMTKMKINALRIVGLILMLASVLIINAPALFHL